MLDVAGRFARTTLSNCYGDHDQPAINRYGIEDQAVTLRTTTDLGCSDHSAGVAAIAFSSDGCGAVHVAGERLRPNRKAATIA